MGRGRCRRRAVDLDGDGVCGHLDNCPNVVNTGQDHTDSDGSGDACDNCTVASNPSQVDTDGDGYGNMCDCDLNQDEFCDEPDLTPFIECY